jgi:hypothetical protein
MVIFKKRVLLCGMRLRIRSSLIVGNWRDDDEAQLEDVDA